MADVVPISEAVRASREAVLGRNLAAHNAGDIDGVLATFSEPRLEVVPSSRVLIGTDEVRAYLESRRHSFPDQSFELIAVHHSDHAVICEYWMSATHLGAFGDTEPTGRRFRARMATIFEFGPDGLISCQRLYYDTGTVVRQLA